MSINPEGVEESEQSSATADVDTDVGTSAEQIESLEAELADVKALNAAICNGVGWLTRQLEEAMVAGIVENGTGGITDGWSAVEPEVRVPIGSYGGVPMFMVHPPSTPGEYDFVMMLGPAGETIMTPISDRARNNEIHRLHRAVLAMRGILIGTGISTSMLDQILGDLRCSSCHLTPIAPGSYQITEPVEDRRSLAQQVVDEYEARRGSLVADVAGLRQRETEEEPLDVRLDNSPRARMMSTTRDEIRRAIVDRYLRSDTIKLDDGVVAAGHMIVEALRDHMVKIYAAGVRRGMAKAGHPGDEFGARAAQHALTDDKIEQMFNKYWLGRQ